MDSDSWEEAVDDVLVLERPGNRRLVDVKVDVLHRMLWCMEMLLTPVERPDVAEQTDLHIREKLEQYVLGIADERERMAVLFKLLLLFGIPSRMYFVLSRDIECFVESRILGAIVQHRRKYAWCVVSVDGALRVRDQSYHFSTAMKHHAAVLHAIRSFAGSVRTVDEDMLGCFDDIDRVRMDVIPKSICGFKKHPKYVVESILKWNQCIYPRRPVFGYFKGEPVCPRENIVQLKTKEQLYRMGRAVGSETPYRVAKNRDGGVKLYAPWQTSDLVVEGFCESMFQDYFHPNFIPRGCVYVNNKHAREVAYLLGLPHRVCFVGFCGRAPVNRGIFLERRSLYLFSNFLAEHCRYTEMRMSNEHGCAAFRLWRAVIRNATRYLRIRRSLGLGNEACG